MAVKKLARASFANLAGARKPQFDTDRLQHLANTGSMLDLWTGSIVDSVAKDDNGKRLTIYNGGIPSTVGIIGRPDRGKTTFKNFIMHSAFSRIYIGASTAMNTYDTEGTTSVHRQATLAARNYEGYGGEDIVANGVWTIRPKLKQSGTEWWEDYKERVDLKAKTLKSKFLETMIFNTITNKPLSVPAYTGDDVDSVTELDTDATEKQLEGAKLGTTDAQTVYMNLGLQRTNMLKAVPKLAMSVNNVTFFTAHVDDKLEMSSGRPGQPPKQKQLRSMKQNDTVKGLPSKALFLLHIILQVVESTPLTNDGKVSLLPVDQHDVNTPSKDLMKMQIMINRSKICETDIEFVMLSSKKYGILPDLSNYYTLKYVLKGVGISGSGQGQYLDIYPNVKFGRTTIRRKIDASQMMRRALQFAMEIWVLEAKHYDMVRGELVPQAEVYSSLVKLGYDVDFIMSSTRNWQAPNDAYIEQVTGLTYLSGYDLLRMAAGEITLKKYFKSEHTKEAVAKLIEKEAA